MSIGWEMDFECKERRMDSWTDGIIEEEAI